MDSEARRPRRLAPQLAIVTLGAVVAAAVGAHTFGVLLASYGLAWLTLNAWIARARALPAVSRRAASVVTALVLATPLTVLAGQLGALAESESLIGLDEHLRDRWRLERSVAVFPRLITSERPQTFFLIAESERRVRVTLAPGVAAIDAEPLGHGLFRVDYDPRVHGAARATGPVEGLVEIDGERLTRVMSSVRPLAHPRWLRVSPDGTRACTTSEETDEAWVIDARGERTRFACDDGPIDCVWLDATNFFVAHRHTPRISLMSTRTGEPALHMPISAGARALAINAERTHLAVALERVHGEAVALESARGEAVALESARGEAVALESARGEVVAIELASGRELDRVETLGAVDALVFTAPRSLVAASRAPAELVRIAIEGYALRIAARRVLVAPAVTLTAIDGGARIVIPSTDWRGSGEPHAGNHYVDDQLLTFDAHTLALVAQLRTARRSPRQDAAGDVDRGVSPMGVATTSSGAWLIAFAGSDELTRVAAIGAEPRSFDVAALGLSAPHSVVSLVDPRDGTSALAATSPSSGRIAILDPVSGALRASVALAPDDATLLREDPAALQLRFGERAFYEGTRAGVSCQSCHLHGESDGMAHNIGGRTLAPTLDVHGIGGTSPYLRDGSYPRIGDLREVADVRYRGYREPAGDRGATLDAWVSSLPLPRSLVPRDLVRERRGLDVFVGAGCVRCHSLPAMTNLGRHPTASVFPRARSAPGASLDTPSLRAVSRRTRWLHDGRAHSLRAIFTQHNPDDRHGRTRALSPRALDDLVGFLESL